ncbi:MAG: LPS assembly lipoprotein LptE [Sedimentisphaerales bacterium]|jgi:hypothetical protein
MKNSEFRIRNKKSKGGRIALPFSILNSQFLICCLSSVFCLLTLAGCAGYSNTSLYPKDVATVYVEMFDNQSFRRGIEFELTDALAKRIEAQTPYKIVTNRDKADTVISGQIVQAKESVLTTERQIGRVLEKNIELRAVVSWKNLRTGEFLIDNKTVIASASYSEWQSQSFAYGSTLAANSLAERIVELMRSGW